MKNTPIWDIPTRIFHILLIAALCFSLYTGLDGGFEIMDYHMISGAFILSLLVFRVGWGIFSRGNARFSNFIVGPKTVIRYIKLEFGKQGFGNTQKDGHNPLGALSVIALITILFAQTLSGLFANDDIMVEGPLAHLVSNDVSGTLTSIHHLSLWFLGGLIGLHIVAVAYHEFIKGHAIIAAMFIGRNSLNTNSESGTRGENIKAVVIFIIAAAAIYYLITYI